MARVAVITVSTSKADGDGVDESGPALQRYVAGLGLELAGAEIVPDDRDRIAERLRHWADEEGCSLIFTSGGTGLSPDDQTPEATLDVIDRQAPGIAEAMRAVSRQHTDKWMLSRGVAGIRGRTLIVNFPGNPPAIGQVGSELAPALPHAIELLQREAPG
jgi:molybdenum cofactor synthesis domain-containing protein